MDMMTWMGSKLIYLITVGNKNEVWMADADGTNKKVLFSRTGYPNIWILYTTHLPENKIYFETINNDRSKNTKFFEYNVNEDKLREFDLSKVIDEVGSFNNTLSGASIAGLSVSPSGKYLTFKTYAYEKINPVYTINLETEEVLNICNDHCHNPVWSN